MSHTDKDLPDHVRAARDGHIKHDHSDGQCVIGTWRDAYEVFRIRRAHSAQCPRYVYVIECVHDTQRQHYQNKVDTARHMQKNCYVVHPDSMIAASNWRPTPTRSLSSQAMTRMLDAGYIPNCTEPKTHLVDLREIDLRLIPGENVSTGLALTRGISAWKVYRTPSILRVRYDESISCAVCEAHPYITCHIDEVAYGKHRHCSCYDDTFKSRYGTRRQNRDQHTKMVRQYNTFGYVED